MYQIAETIGTSVEAVRDTLTPEEMVEWGYYLNSPFSNRGRELLLNGWLVHIIRSIVATKTSKPKVKDSIFPFDKMQNDFFAEGRALRAKKIAEEQKDRRGKKAGGVSESDRKVLSVTEAQHMALMIRQRMEQAEKDYKSGKVPNRFGYFYGERMA